MAKMGIIRIDGVELTVVFYLPQRIQGKDVLSSCDKDKIYMAVNLHDEFCFYDGVYLRNSLQLDDTANRLIRWGSKVKGALENCRLKIDACDTDSLSIEGVA